MWVQKLQYNSHPHRQKHKLGFLCNNVALFPSVCTDNNTWNRTSDGIEDHRNEHVCGHEVDVSGSCTSISKKTLKLLHSDTLRALLIASIYFSE